MTNIFKKRVKFKPFEYSEITQFKDAINHSYWLVSEWNFISDVQDFKTKLTDTEREAIKRTMAAISQIEVSVKKFWTKIGDHFPKPEIDQVGITFGESEVRHSDAYSHLLEVLGMNDYFEKIIDHPVMQGRVDYLSKYLSNSNSTNHKDYLLSLALFSLFIENVSLFSQFAIIKSFHKHKNMLKDIDNVVSATMLEENVHALFGIWLINQVKKENPGLFDDAFYTKIKMACDKAYEAESKIIDWIFENGELDFISKDLIKSYIKKRFNESLESIGYGKLYQINQDDIKDLLWMDEEIHAKSNSDFFFRRPVSYSKGMQSITAEDLF